MSAVHTNDVNCSLKFVTVLVHSVIVVHCRYQCASSLSRHYKNALGISHDDNVICTLDTFGMNT